jgi:hypothetical protein
MMENLKYLTCHEIIFTVFAVNIFLKSYFKKKLELLKTKYPNEIDEFVFPFLLVKI